MDDFGSLHHVELRVADLTSAEVSWAWLFTELGYEPYQTWVGGRSWRHGATYVVIAEAPAAGSHDRRAPGLSHLAFHAGTRADIDHLWASAPDHGWSHLSLTGTPGPVATSTMPGSWRTRIGSKSSWSRRIPCTN